MVYTMPPSGNDRRARDERENFKRQAVQRLKFLGYLLRHDGKHRGYQIADAATGAVVYGPDSKLSLEDVVAICNQLWAQRYPDSPPILSVYNHDEYKRWDAARKVAKAHLQNNFGSQSKQ